MKRIVGALSALALGLVAGCTASTPDGPPEIMPTKSPGTSIPNPETLASAVSAWVGDQGSGRPDLISGTSAVLTGERTYTAIEPQSGRLVAACAGAAGTAQLALSTGRTLDVPCTAVGIAPIVDSETIPIDDLTLTITATDVPEGAAWTVGPATLGDMPSAPTVGAEFLQSSVAFEAQKTSDSVTANGAVSESDSESGSGPVLAGPPGPLTAWAVCAAPSGTMTVSIAGLTAGEVPCDPSGTQIAEVFSVDDASAGAPVYSVSGVAAGSAWAVGFVPG